MTENRAFALSLACCTTILVLTLFVMGCIDQRHDRQQKSTQATMPEAYVDGVMVKYLNNDDIVYANIDSLVVDHQKKVWIKDVTTIKHLPSNQTYIKIFKKNNLLYIVVIGKDQFNAVDVWHYTQTNPHFYYEDQECKKRVYPVAEIVIKKQVASLANEGFDLFFDKTVK